MPSYRLAGSTVSLGIFDVVGQDGAEHGFIGHTGIAEPAGSHATAWKRQRPPTSAPRRSTLSDRRGAWLYPRETRPTRSWKAGVPAMLGILGLPRWWRASSLPPRQPLKSLLGKARRSKGAGG